MRLACLRAAVDVASACFDVSLRAALLRWRAAASTAVADAAATEAHARASGYQQQMAAVMARPASHETGEREERRRREEAEARVQEGDRARALLQKQLAGYASHKQLAKATQERASQPARLAC